jgi:hypothetical protein
MRLRIKKSIKSLQDSRMTFRGAGRARGRQLRLGRNPDTAVASDLNKDGQVDLVVSNRTDGTLSILLGNGDGTFTTQCHDSDSHPSGTRKLY